ncbi:MAG: SDR family oxidoreductase [Tangfeifania sp.]
MQRVIINGANGYVASHFVNELLEKGYKVVALVRETAGLAAEQRMKKTLKKINPRADFKNLDVFNYSLLGKNYSLNSQQLGEIFKDDADFFHFAASLKFKSRDKDEIFKTNVEGAENTLKVFTDNATSSSRFFYISTVYSCGKISEPFKEDFYENEGISNFRNYYEQSKRYAENLLKTYIERENLNAHIVRLSQVVGHNKTGETKTNYGVFDFVQKIQKFSSHYPNERIRIKVNPDATQNLVPIDNVVAWLMKLLTRKDFPVILNFAGRKSVTNNEIARIVNKVLPVVYTDTNLEFDTKNLEKTVSPNGYEVTPESLHKMISYFVDQQAEHNRKAQKSL